MTRYKLITQSEFPNNPLEGQMFMMLDTGATYVYRSGNWIHIATATCDF